MDCKIGQRTINYPLSTINHQPMIDGIGIDIIEVGRVARAIRSERFVTRVFTSAEAAECRGRGCPEQRFAGRFAAKEAVAKALGRAVSWREVEIRSGVRGEPQAVLTGRAAALLDGRSVRISISHCHSHAVAQAIIFAPGMRDEG